MDIFQSKKLVFQAESLSAQIIAPDGRPIQRPIEVRTNPVTGRTSRITFSRAEETEAGTARLPAPPPDAARTDNCPFCPACLEARTPRLAPDLAPEGRLRQGASVLFPNLFPYARYSGVSLFDHQHFVEIGTAQATAYAASFRNCRDYLARVKAQDPDAVCMAITQNHLPSAGGSLLHPHLQVHADRIAPNHHRFLRRRTRAYPEATGRLLFSDYLAHEKSDGRRWIGRCGAWSWMAAYAPEGFYELWAILPGRCSLLTLEDAAWDDLADGVTRAQHFYRHLNRNGYNLGLLALEDDNRYLELRLVMLARANHAPWARNDHTGFEVMLGDMATFNAPEEIAAWARPFWEP
jgi:UDPglucose--hexose-1-phosphate uridylyltransferase